MNVKTISQRLRELAFRHDSEEWRSADFDLCWDVLLDWRSWRTESLDDLTPDEWFLFCNFVAAALETEEASNALPNVMAPLRKVEFSR